MKLRKIDLKKAVKTDDGNGYDHPDISLKKWYLAKAGDRWAGKFNRRWYGLSFEGFYAMGKQFDPSGTNSSTWQELYEIVKRG